MIFLGTESSLAPSIAVILATYNGDKYVKEQLMSLQSQIGVNITVFVSDDCSTDNTLSVIKEFSCADFCSIKIVILDKDIKFGSAAFNFLSAIIKTPVGEFEYVCFCDQDDIWLPNKLIRAVHLLREHNVGGYSSNCISWNHASGRCDLIKKDYPQTPFDYMFQTPGPGCSMVIRASDALLLANFLEKLTDLDRSRVLWHDWFIYAFFRANNLGWYIDSYTSLLYRQHGANVIGANVGLSGILSRLKLFQRWKKEVVFLANTLGYQNKLPVKSSKDLRFFFITSLFKSRRRLLDSLLLTILSVFLLL